MSNNDVQDNIGKAIGRIPSGIAILTTQHGEEKSSMLASWYQQCSFEPPMVTVAIKEGRPAEALLKSSEKFVLNILHTEQRNVMAHFGKGFKPGEDPFVGVEIEIGQSGQPVLKKCLCFLECEVRHIFPAGDHQLFVGEVTNAGFQEEGEPRIHLRKNGLNY